MKTKYLFLIFLLTQSVVLFAAELTFRPCSLPDMKPKASCTTIEVWENRDAKDRKLPIKVAILKGTSKKRQPDPLFVLGGGPGQAASAIADFTAEHFAAIRSSRDFVFVDVRGTGESNPLTCDLYGPDVKSYFSDLFPMDRLKQCKEELEKRADLKLYTTTEVVRDLEEVRQALGYEKINLYGTSYGTRVALVFMRMYPQSLRAVILHGPAPTDLKAPLYHAWAGQQSLEDVFRQCEADKKCHNAFPNLQKEFREVLARLDQWGMTTEVDDPATKKKETVPFTRGVFGEVLRNLLYNPTNVSKLPLWIHKAHGGYYQNFAQANLGLRRAYQAGLAFGMFHSVCCAEDIPFITKEDVERETKGTFLGDYRIAQQQKACEIWPRGSIPEGYREPVRSDVPTLIVAGELDPVTPPRFGKEIADHLTQVKNIVVKGGSHSGGDACLDSIMVAFIRSANPTTLNESCLSKASTPIRFEVQ